MPDGHDHPHPQPARPASVTFRPAEEGAGASASLMDPANQSLAEALRLTFRILVLALVVLLALFALSGFQSIKEGESGVRLLFGRKTGDDLPPGFRFAWPYPFGELIRVNKGTQTITLGQDFWPYLQESDRTMPIATLAGRSNNALKPGMDWSLITADRNLAHAQWKVEYRRVRPGDFIENINSDDPARVTAEEEKIVRAAVRRGVVHAVAATPIDDLLKQSSSDESSVAGQAKRIAQETLDRLNSGIEIERLSMEEKIPPLNTYNDFTSVEAAQSEAAKRIQNAQSVARTTLNGVAGAAYPVLIEQIEQYERAVETGDQERQAAVLARINALLDGRPVEIDGQTYANAVSGKVAAIISEAQQYRSTVYSRGQAELAMFQAKLEQFRVNPRVTLQRDWADALQTFLSRENVQIFSYLPGPKTSTILVSQDPEIVKEMERQANIAAAERARRERQRQQEREAFNLNTDVIEMETGG